jgi:transposase
VLRVYDLQGRVVRVDTTTAAAYVTPDGMFPRGHSQEHRPDLPQVQIAMAVLDPLGWPLTTTVVAGQTADDPLDWPEMAKVRQIAQAAGLPYVGDCKMAARSPRAESVAQQDDSLCPLSAKQMPETALDRVLAPVFRNALVPSELRLPPADGTLDETDEPVALGFADTGERSAPAQSGQARTWQERRLVVRALALAASQEQSLHQRVTRAVTARTALEARKQGQPRLPNEAAAYQAAAAVLAKHRVEGLGNVTVPTDVCEHVKRRYGPRPAPAGRSERVRVCAAYEEATLVQAVRRLGWRVYATHHPAEALSLAQGVAAYRSEYLIEQGCGRLTGRALSLTPLCLQDEHRGVALICLLRIALRLLVLLQFVVRRTLQQAGATLKGIYPGQPGRQTAQPTTEMMLLACRGVTRSCIKIEGTLHEYLTPLHGLQKRLLALMEGQLEIYAGLVTRCSKTDFYSRET